MVSRSERLADRCRSFHQQICAVQSENHGSAVEMLPIIQDVEDLYRDCISNGYDPRYDCHHRPLFHDSLIRDLVEALVEAQLSVLWGELGHQTSLAIMAAAESVMGRHGRPARERSRASARRDVARTALCHAVISAMDATLNAVVATRLSKTKASRISRGRARGAS